MPCASVLGWIQLFKLLIYLIKCTSLFVANTVFLPIFLSFVYLLFVLAFLLLILLNLKPIFCILLHYPTILNSFPLCFRLNELIAFEVFEDGQEVAFEDISETVFFLDGKEGKQVVDGWKGMFVVIVTDDDLSNHILFFGLRNRRDWILLFRTYRLDLWFDLSYLFLVLNFIFHLLYSLLFCLCLHNHIRHILFLLSKSPIMSSRLFDLSLDVGLLREGF